MEAPNSKQRSKLICRAFSGMYSVGKVNKGWWTLEFKAVKFPTTANTTVFDYYIDPETKKFELWSRKVPKFELDPDIPLQAALVPTPETVRIRYWMGKRKR